MFLLHPVAVLKVDDLIPTMGRRTSIEDVRHPNRFLSIFCKNIFPCYSLVGWLSRSLALNIPFFE